MGEPGPGDLRPGASTLLPEAHSPLSPGSGWGRGSNSLAHSRPRGRRPPRPTPAGQWLGGGRLRANSRVNGRGRPPRTAAPCPPTPGQGRGPPASARSAAIHHLDPWRALTAAPAALTRLTKQFATSHLLDRLLARPPLKEPSPPPPPPPAPTPAGGIPALSPPADRLLPPSAQRYPEYCWRFLITPKYPHTYTRSGPLSAHSFLPSWFGTCSAPSLQCSHHSQNPTRAPGPFPHLSLSPVLPDFSPYLLTPSRCPPLLLSTLLTCPTHPLAAGTRNPSLFPGWG